MFLYTNFGETLDFDFCFVKNYFLQKFTAPRVHLSDKKKSMPFPPLAQFLVEVWGMRKKATIRYFTNPVNITELSKYMEKIIIFKIKYNLLLRIVKIGQNWAKSAYSGLTAFKIILLSSKDTQN